MWLSSRLALIQNHPGPALLIGPDALGISRLVAECGDKVPLIWLELEATDAGDPISVGEKLSHALKTALGHRLFPSALPYPTALDFLRANLELLGPLTLAVSRADLDFEVAQAFLRSHSAESQIVLAGTFTKDMLYRLQNAGVSDRLLTLGKRDLQLTDDEALDLAAGRLETGEVMYLLSKSKGAYETFLTALHDRLSLPIASVPSPNGLRLPEGRELAVDPEALLNVLVEKKDWVRAAEVAAIEVPHRTAEVLAEAGHVFHERGLHERLWRLLERLPGEVKRQHPQVLFWRLSAAVRLGKQGELRPTVEAYLEQSEAPELRALYAGVFLNSDEAREELRRATKVWSTPFTLYQYGHFIADPNEGARVLRDAVRLAERQGRPYEVARNAGTLTARLIDAGAYREAEKWGAWALEHFDRHEVEDTQRRLYLLNNLAYARILLGETVGLEVILRDGEAHLSRAFPSLLKLFRSTLGNYLVATERPAEALAYYRLNWEQAERWSLGVYGLNMVQALLSLDPPEAGAAKGIAEQAFYVTRGEGWDYHYPAVLAQGLALVQENPKKAITLLTQVLRDGPTALPAPHAVQATLYLANAYLELGRREEARHLIRTLPALRDMSLSGLRLLSSRSQSSHEIDRWCLGTDAPLELHFLGRAEATYNGVPLALSPQQREIIMLLAYYPGGVPTERLLAYLSGDRPNLPALYTAMSKLRQQVPISPAPYTLQVSVQADFLEALNLLKNGQVRRAFDIRRGPLLPESEAPEVCDLRAVIEEAYRQTALSTRDPEVLLDLSQTLEADLEVWEAALQALPETDLRRPLVEAQARRILKEL